MEIRNKHNVNCFTWSNFSFVSATVQRYIIVKKIFGVTKDITVLNCLPHNPNF